MWTTLIWLWLCCNMHFKIMLQIQVVWILNMWILRVVLAYIFVSVKVCLKMLLEMRCRACVLVVVLSSLILRWIFHVDSWIFKTKTSVVCLQLYFVQCESTKLQCIEHGFTKGRSTNLLLLTVLQEWVKTSKLVDRLI